MLASQAKSKVVHGQVGPAGLDALAVLVLGGEYMTSCHVNHTTSRGCSRAMAMMKWVLRCPEPSLAWRDLRKDWICVDGWGAGGLHMSHICMERDMNAILRTHIQRNNTTANLTHETWQTSACISDTHAHPVHFLRDKCILMFSYISTNQGPCDPPSALERCSVMWL